MFYSSLQLNSPPAPAQAYLRAHFPIRSYGSNDLMIMFLQGCYFTILACTHSFPFTMTCTLIPSWVLWRFIISPMFQLYTFLPLSLSRWWIFAGVIHGVLGFLFCFWDSWVGKGNKKSTRKEKKSQNKQIKNRVLISCLIHSCYHYQHSPQEAD